MYDINGERGYNVTFDVIGKGAEPVAVVINRIRKEINPSDRKDNTYHINVIAETRKIHGYRPQRDTTGKRNYLQSKLYRIFQTCEIYIKINIILTRNIMNVPFCLILGYKTISCI